MFKSLYAFIWHASARGQIILCILTLLVVPLSMVPLELQRRILEDALGRREMPTLVWLSAVYLAVMLVQGGLKYVLNVQRGRVVEEVVRRLRMGIYSASLAPRPADADPDEPPPEKGALVSMVAAEAEHLGGFVGESVSMPRSTTGSSSTRSDSAPSRSPHWHRPPCGPRLGAGPAVELPGPAQ